MERAFGFDTMEIGHPDYSFKPAKAVLSLEQLCMAQAQLDCIVPLFYGAMPNMGLYFRPDGPLPTRPTCSLTVASRRRARHS